LTRLVEDAVGRGLDLTIIIHPKHAYFYEKLVLCGGAQEHWRRVWWIAKVVEDAAGDAGRIPVWYFTPYHRFMVEPVPSHDPMKYWQDPGHYNYELGDAIQDLVFDSYDADRGDVSDLGLIEVTSAIWDSGFRRRTWRVTMTESTTSDGPSSRRIRTS
jgi:hypothetical protein